MYGLLVSYGNCYIILIARTMWEYEIVVIESRLFGCTVTLERSAVNALSLKYKCVNVPRNAFSGCMLVLVLFPPTLCSCHELEFSK